MDWARLLKQAYHLDVRVCPCAEDEVTARRILDYLRLPSRARRRVVAWKNSGSGRIGSLIELLQGRFSAEVMQVLAREEAGLFPAPGAIEMTCSCPDWATMCKHVAATLYGVGPRLDERTELFFTLRQVDELELVASAGEAAAIGAATPSAEKRLRSDDDLSALFGIDLDGGPSGAPPPPRTLLRRGLGITVAELIAAGIPRSTFQNWVTRGELRRTDRRGVYLPTPKVERRIAAFHRA
jgi:hypothetical protein